jgi:UDP-N-acetyl-D-glucosamine dehydrogenase
MHRLQDEGAQVSYHDPYVPVCANGGGPLMSVTLEEERAESDCVVILTDHSCLPYEQIVARAGAIVDTRNALRDHDSSRIVRL